MSEKIGGVVALVGMCAVSLLLLNCGSSSSRPAGVLYVLTQGTNAQGNPSVGYNVSSFAINLNTGNLSLVNSNASTCPTQATLTKPIPCGAPLDIVLDPTGATAFVLNQGILTTPVPPTIYSYTVNSDGSLGAPSASPAATLATGITPVAMVRDAAGQFLFVIDEGVYPLPLGCPAVGTLDPSNPIYVGCPSITVFAISSTTLTLASGSPVYLSKTPSGLSAITFTKPGSTTSQELLFVTNNYDLCTVSCLQQGATTPGPATPYDNTVSVYGVNADGTLSEQTSYSPLPIAAPNPVSVLAVNTYQPGEGDIGGVFVYVGNSSANGGDLNPFVLCTVSGNNGCTETGILIPLVQTCSEPPCNNVPPYSAGSDPVAMVVDPTNSFLYSLSNGVADQVYGFFINPTAGTLTVLSNSPQPSQGSQPVSIALHPSVYIDGNFTGQYLFVSNSNSQSIAGFTLSTTTGVMGNATTTIAPAAPSGIAVH